MTTEKNEQDLELILCEDCASNEEELKEPLLEKKQNRITINIKSDKLYKRLMDYKMENKLNLSDFFCSKVRVLLDKK